MGWCFCDVPVTVSWTLLLSYHVNSNAPKQASKQQPASITVTAASKEASKQDQKDPQHKE
jgi:hypothetical protein